MIFFTNEYLLYKLKHDPKGYDQLYNNLKYSAIILLVLFIVTIILVIFKII